LEAGVLSKIVTTHERRQTVYWGVLIVGGGLFMYQMSDLLAEHSTWADVVQPAGVADILKTLGGAIVAVGGALGIRLPGASAPAPPADQDSTQG
jgi:hypothetical protein